MKIFIAFFDERCFPLIILLCRLHQFVFACPRIGLKERKLVRNLIARPFHTRDVTIGKQWLILSFDNMASKHKKQFTAQSGGQYCVAGGPNNESCKNSSSTEGISMHSFPANEDTRKKWILFVRRHRPNFEPRRYAALCSIHFEPSCFQQRYLLSEVGGESSAPTKRRLAKGAVPSIHCANVAPSNTQEAALSAHDRRQVRHMFCFDTVLHVRLI